MLQNAEVRRLAQALGVTLHLVAVDRAGRAVVDACETVTDQPGTACSCMPELAIFFFFFWIRGSTDLQGSERILGGSGSIRVSVDSFYP